MAPKGCSTLLIVLLASSASASREETDLFSEDDLLVDVKKHGSNVVVGSAMGKVKAIDSAMDKLKKGGCTWKLCEKGAQKRMVGKSNEEGACWLEALTKKYPFEQAADNRHGDYIVVNPQPCATEAECQNGDGNDYWTNTDGAFEGCYDFDGYSKSSDSATLPTCTAGQSATGKQVGCATATGCHWKKCQNDDQIRYVGLPEGVGSNCWDQSIKKNYEENKDPQVNRDGPVVVVNPGPCKDEACSRGKGFDFWVNTIEAYKQCYGFAGYKEVSPNEASLPSH